MIAATHIQIFTLADAELAWLHDRLPDVDFVVRSAKDLPTAPVPGLQIAAFPAREDPRDALIWPGGTHLGCGPRSARIGTGSPRRAALLRATRRELGIVPSDSGSRWPTR